MTPPLSVNQKKHLFEACRVLAGFKSSDIGIMVLVLNDHTETRTIEYDFSPKIKVALRQISDFIGKTSQSGVSLKLGNHICHFLNYSYVAKREITRNEYYPRTSCDSPRGYPEIREVVRTGLYEDYTINQHTLSISLPITGKSNHLLLYKFNVNLSIEYDKIPDKELIRDQPMRIFEKRYLAKRKYSSLEAPLRGLGKYIEAYLNANQRIPTGIVP